jgi:hypothetical protein
MKKISILLFVIAFNAQVMAGDILKINYDNEFTPTFNNRFSFMLGANPNFVRPTDILNFAFAYANKFNNFWLDAHVSITNGVFRKLTTNNSAATGTSGQTLEDKRDNLTTFGLGFSKESKLSQEFFNSNSTYEISTASLTYNIFKEQTQSKSFTGPGILTKFSLFKKTSESSSIGGLLAYHLAVVKRSKDYGTEPSSSSSLTLSHLTIGLDFSLFL